MLLVSVIVRYDEWGRMGNRMFQYAFGYILAKQRGVKLFAPALPNFGITETPFYHFKCADGTSNDKRIYTRSFGSQRADWSALLAAPAETTIIVDSYLQRAEYYVNHQEELRQVFSIVKVEPKNTDALVVHVRETDYKDMGLFLGYDFYKQAIKDSGFSKIILITDNSQCETVQKLIADGCLLHTEGYVNKFTHACDERGIMDFICLLQSANILLSQSSFSWWAAFLGNHEKVVFPYKESGGMWKCNPGPEDIDLFINAPNFLKYTLP